MSVCVHVKDMIKLSQRLVQTSVCAISIKRVTLSPSIRKQVCICTAQLSAREDHSVVCLTSPDCAAIGDLARSRVDAVVIQGNLVQILVAQKVKSYLNIQLRTTLSVIVTMTAYNESQIQIQYTSINSLRSIQGSIPLHCPYPLDEPCEIHQCSPSPTR